MKDIFDLCPWFLAQSSERPWDIQRAKSVLFKILHLFIFGCAGSSLPHVGFLQLQQERATLHCSEWASHCGASLVAEHGVSGARALVVVAQGLSCSAARGIFPDQGLNLSPLHWQVDSYPLCQ